jgi:ABC-type Fe3+/spermidine/putrescine transport system ATPase subunit
VNAFARATSEAAFEGGRPLPPARDKAVFLKVDGVSVDYGAVRVLDGLDLSVRRGEFVALLGSSGCGKTTLLRAIAGFIKPRSGQILVGGRDVTNLPPDKRGMALVFQSYALWPHMTLAQNIGYGLKLRGMPRGEIAGRVAEIQDLLGLNGLEERKPGALSGGQRQRVALGRALAIQPDILLLDEPLSNLDARIRLTVRHEISALQRRLGITAIHVTHDREEAMVMADRIVILDAGEIAQVGTPEDLFNQPKSPFVAAFMGADNVVALSASRNGDVLHVAQSGINKAAAIRDNGRNLTGSAFEGRFRAEAAELHPIRAFPVDPAADDALLLVGDVTQVSYPGGLWRHLVSVGGRIVVVDAPRVFEPGSKVFVKVPGQSLFLFPVAASGPSTSAPLEAS